DVAAVREGEGLGAGRLGLAPGLTEQMRLRQTGVGMRPGERSSGALGDLDCPPGMTQGDFAVAPRPVGEPRPADVRPALDIEVIDVPAQLQRPLELDEAFVQTAQATQQQAPYEPQDGVRAGVGDPGPDARVSSGELDALISDPKPIDELSGAEPRIRRRGAHRRPDADVTGAVGEVDGLEGELELVDVAGQPTDAGVAGNQIRQHGFLSASAALRQTSPLGVDVDRLVFKGLLAVVARA